MNQADFSNLVGVHPEQSPSKHLYVGSGTPEVVSQRVAFGHEPGHVSSSVVETLAAEEESHFDEGGGRVDVLPNLPWPCGGIVEIERFGWTGQRLYGGIGCAPCVGWTGNVGVPHDSTAACSVARARHKGERCRSAFVECRIQTPHTPRMRAKS